jgi:pyruvate/2-oxoglutarate dehydrogenase complex dihydrolipoamide dehydrogenase (E3) component
MWYATYLNDMHHLAPGYGFQGKDYDLDWAQLIKVREQYIARAASSYEGKLQRLNITTIHGMATLSQTGVMVNSQAFEGRYRVLATGSKPQVPNIPGAELGITSDGFFKLSALPKKVAVVGGGYIALELAGILKAFGTQTHLCVRSAQLLNGFDESLQNYAKESLSLAGASLHFNTQVARLERQANGLISLYNQDEEPIHDLEHVIWATGREPQLEGLDLAQVGIALNAKGLVETDSMHQTTCPNTYAIGDLTDYPALTPVAIRMGRRVAAHLFGGEILPLEKELVPSVLFAHPPLATIGLSEQQARASDADIKVYQGSFKAMLRSFSLDAPQFSYKLITQGLEEKIVGLHVAGDFADELMQGFAVAITMGATKKDLMNTIPIHPSLAEELVLIN